MRKCVTLRKVCGDRILSQYLREERREEIYENFKLSQAEEQNGKLKFSNNINELKQLIED
jgi:hypothetical protein